MAILIIEDNQEIREFLQDILTDILKLEVETAKNGTIGLEKINQIGSDLQLVISDVDMPETEVDGYQILKEMGICMPKVPVIIMSGGNTRYGKTPEEMKPFFLKEGAYDFMGKPFSLEKIVEVVGIALLGQDQK
jgi:DNA-binding NtrC family response regulator